MLQIDRTVPAVVDWIMLSLPWLGTNLTILPILVAVALWLWRKKGRADLALQLLVVCVGSLVLNAVLKDLFNRPRPDLWPHRGQFQWMSYPSGHAIIVVAVYFTIARMLHRERRWRWPYVVSAVMLVVNLYSRMYLGVHWPTDVIGGALLGLAWLLMVAYAFKPFAERHRAGSATRAGRPNPNDVGSRSSIEGAGA
jgi:undecaprenyl-diphosphatase